MENSNDKAVFFGEITASVTHELQNVLAIIKENSGLMEDILLMSQNSESDLCERLQKSLGSIKKQISRGVNLTSRLNRFSHTADHAEAQININETLKRLIFLTGRITKLKGVEVSFEESEKRPFLLTDPVFFQVAAFLCIKSFVSILKPKTKISVLLADSTIEFRCDSTDLQENVPVEKSISPAKWAEIKKTCGQINIRAEKTTDAPGILLTFKK